MNISDIIKEAFIFPSKDWKKLAIYIVIGIIAGLIFGIGIVVLAFGIAADYNIALMILSIILIIAALALFFVIKGYQLGIIKSGIDGTESAPEFSLKENCLDGIKYLVVDIVYYIIPSIIVLIVAVATNLFGLMMKSFNLMYEAGKHATPGTQLNAYAIIPQSLLIDLGTAMIITGLVAFVLFLIFDIFQTMGETRLANTGSLGDALNIPEAFRDVGRIGWGKVIAVVVLVFVINLIVTGIIRELSTNVSSVIGIISIVVSPYLVFFGARAIGLMYSDIA